MSKPVKVVVAEPSVIVRSGIVSVLRRMDGLQMEIYEIGDVEQLRSTLAWQKPDMLMINPSLVGLYSLQQIRKDADLPEMKCVALQFSLADGTALRAYDEIISLYDTAEQIRDKMTRLITQPGQDRRHQSLSQREKEVIVCVIQGLTNKQIADKLCLSTHTVITHRRNISSKLQIHSTAGLTIYAIVNKLVDLEDIKDTGAQL
ncbi:response regulator transcription factor [Alistipes sp. OttesenSCG-928-B03]|nr:response regulator transcription factor [Alistipes sp. OttesenSCG-928-B03]